jgi:uncharacterized membrane-anchored protein
MKFLQKFLGLEFFIMLFAAIFFYTAATAGAQESDINWIIGPKTVTLGDDVAHLAFGADYVFADGEDTRKAMAKIGNPPTNREVGLIIPRTPDANWFVVFEYFPVGYIRDKDKDAIDADAILKSLKEGTEASNKFRTERGIPPIHVTGWYQEPFYDASTNNLTWSTLLVSEGDENGMATVNHNIRLLGRHGYMSVVLVTDRATLDALKPEVDSLISNFSFAKGKRYAEWVKGDKVAKYGLTALIAGGAATVAAKTGILKLLAKYAKIILIAVIGFLAALWGRIKSLFTKADRKQFVTSDETALPESETDDTIK